MNQGKVTTNELSQYAKNKPFLMVVIYANWCGHCKEMIKTLGPKMRNYDDLLFFEQKYVDDQLGIYFPRVLIYSNGVSREGTVEDLYDLLEV